MTKMNNSRRSGRQPETPQRVTNAAEQMRNMASYGNTRGYVPGRNANQAPVQGMPGQPGNRPPVYGAPVQQRIQPPAYHAVPQSTGEFRGFGKPAVQEKKQRNKRNVWLILLLAVLVIGLIAGGTTYGIKLSKEAEERKAISDRVTPYDGLYCPGVYVNGIHLGGMTPEQALNSVQSQISQAHSAWSVNLTYQGETAATINSDLLNISVDENAIRILLNEAWKPGHTGTQAERFAQMEELENNPYTVYTDKPDGDTSRIDAVLENLKQKIDRPARDAYALFDASKSYPFEFSNEETGLVLNISPLKEQLYQMASTMTSGTVELEPTVIQPNTTVAELQKRCSQRAEATTPIARSSEEGRNNNIRRCFELINGTVLEPGEKFSFNKIVGERTYENGFYDAPEYINDEHVTGIGGGACQASTTVYQAAVCAGLQIITRKPHSDSVSYADYGKDATVFMGGKQIDLVFKNNTDDRIYITAAVVNDPKNKGRLKTKVCIYGADLGNVVYRLETQTVTTLPSIMEPVYVNDKESAAKAKDGCIVNSYRVTYTDGVPTAQEFLFEDTYKPKPEKIYQPSYE